MYQKFFKRLLDFTLAVIGSIGALPILIPTAILLTIANRGTPFFFQARPGKNGRIFTIVKFKTMNDKKDEHGQLLPDAKRLTTIGRLIRKSSIDEIPQLWNVLIGDMSLVGPRPLLPEYLPLYNDFQKRRHEVRPGITGWAQVNGRNAVSWEQKFEYDVWYVDHVSFLLDVKILLLTVKKVFKKEGIAVEGASTIGRFKGNN
jgi:undecaprenyl phosphate N,N'-diacetylbacillosamine 1-phosphate transferase